MLSRAADVGGWGLENNPQGWPKCQLLFALCLSSEDTVVPSWLAWSCGHMSRPSWRPVSSSRQGQ